MARTLPPLNWIRAFEAAARHQSFSHAAEELGVSDGAISQKVKALELHLSASLFTRHPSGVQLTDQGRHFRDILTPALDTIAEAANQLMKSGTIAKLRIRALPALAEKWLTPRLPDFQNVRPDVDVELSAGPELGPLTSFDAALHYETTTHADLISRPLFHDRLAPVCAPSIAAKITKPEDLLSQTLLQDTQWSDDWKLWFREAGLPETSGQRESGFTLYSMAIEAAVQGLGIAMGHIPLVEQDIAVGRLVAPFDLTVAAPNRYVIHVPRWSRTKPAVRDFQAWVLEQALK